MNKMQKLSENQLKDILELASQPKEELKRRDEVVPHYKNYEEASKALMALYPALANEKPQTLKTKLGELAARGAFELTPSGCITQASLESFAKKGAVIEVTPEHLVSIRQVVRSKNAGESQPLAKENITHINLQGTARQVLS